MKIFIFPADRWPEEEFIVKFPQNDIFLHLPKKYFPNLLPPFQTLKKKIFPPPIHTIQPILSPRSNLVSNFPGNTRPNLRSNLAGVYIHGGGLPLFPSREYPPRQKDTVSLEFRLFQGNLMVELDKEDAARHRRWLQIEFGSRLSLTRISVVRAE